MPGPSDPSLQAKRVATACPTVYTPPALGDAILAVGGGATTYEISAVAVRPSWVAVTV